MNTTSLTVTASPPSGAEGRGLSVKKFIKFLFIMVILPAVSLPAAPAAPVDSYTVADATGDWGYPSPFGHYPRGPGYVRMQFVFETLVWKDAGGFCPQLARAWSFDEKENAYTFHLREDVKWHDGAALTAGDVVFTYQYAKEHPCIWVDNSIVQSAVALDNYTVKLYLARPYASFLQDVAGVQPVIPEHIWRKVTEPEKFTGPEALTGTGPYLSAGYHKEHGTYLYQANDRYYLGRPAVKEIKFIKINAAMIPAALRNGVVNAGSVPPEIIAGLEKQGLTVIAEPPAWTLKMLINHQKAPLSTPEFRRALAYTVDRDALVQVTQRGFALPGSPGLIPPAGEWYNPDTPAYKYDPEKAGQILTGLGYRREGAYFCQDNKELRLELIAAADYKEVGRFVRGQLEEAGLQVDFRLLEAKTVDAKVQAWDFDLALCGHGGLYDPSILHKLILGDDFNSARYEANQTLTGLIQAQLGEVNSDKRKELVFSIQELYAEEMPALTLYYPQWYWAHDGRVDLFFTKDGIAGGIPLPLNRAAFVLGDE